MSMRMKRKWLLCGTSGELLDLDLDVVVMLESNWKVIDRGRFLLRNASSDVLRRAAAPIQHSFHWEHARANGRINGETCGFSRSEHPLCSFRTEEAKAKDLQTCQQEILQSHKRRGGGVQDMTERTYASEVAVPVSAKISSNKAIYCGSYRVVHPFMPKWEKTIHYYP